MGKRGRREFGKTSKTIYENLGGYESAKKDYDELYRIEILPWLYGFHFKGLNEPVKFYYEEEDFVEFIVYILKDKEKREKLLYQDVRIIKSSYGAWKEHSTQEIKDFLIQKLKYYHKIYDD